MDVPDEIIDKIDLMFYPPQFGVVVFAPGFGLDELLAAWSTIPKRIEPVNP